MSRLLAAALLMLLMGTASETRADNPPATLQSGGAMTKLQKKQAAFAEKWGRALFDAYNTAGKVSDITMDRSLATATSAVTDKCDVRYRALLVIPPGISTDRLAVYYIGTPQDGAEVMIGRHYRVIVSGDGKTAQSVTPSTKDCTFVAPDVVGQGTSGVLTSDPDIPAPTDIHVFLSLVTGQTLFVGTKAGYWRVNQGKIELLKSH
ncbi:MAG: hypothetical protein ACKVOI_01070 [Dongiaceae bacterium]